MHYWRSIIIGGFVITCVVTYSVLVFVWSRDICPVGTFPCSDLNVCVPQRSVCNNHKDCSNGEDEDPVLCTDMNGSINMVLRTYNNSKKRKILAKIKNTCDIPWYPDNCICKYQYRLICKNIGLVEVPQNISRNVMHFIFANNSIDKLENDSFAQYQKLEVIHLEGNHLIDLPVKVFYNQNQLLRLFLMHNNITILKNGSLYGLHELLWLMLNNNHIHIIEMDALKDLCSVEWIDLSHNKLTLENESFPPLLKLLEVLLNYNNIVRITKYTFRQLLNLELLNLRKNQIRVIEDNAFEKLINLRELNLDGNYLTQLEPELFRTHSLLTKLYLGNNPLQHIPSNLFYNLDQLASLNLADIEITNIDLKIFSNLKKLESVYFKKYHYCSFAPNVPHCRPLSDGVSSTHQLLEKPILRYTTWITCSLTCIGNILVMWGRITIRDENKVLSIVLRNLAASDLLMGIYLLIIGFQDFKFRDIYNTQAQYWMSSWLCTFSGILAMTSSEVSVLLLVFMSVERFLLIAVPFGHFSPITLKTASIILLSIWVLGIGFAIIPVIEFFSSTKFYGLNGLCFPLHIEDPFLLGWKYSAVIMLGINATSLLIIAIVYCIMFVSIWRTRNATSLPIKEFEFAIRFFFIVITDASCWFPIILIKLLALMGMEIPADLYAWLVVFVLPVNSAINPFLYTFTTPRYRSKMYKLTAPLDCTRVHKNLYLVGKIRRPSPLSNLDTTGSTPTAGRCGQSGNITTMMKKY